jgi:hypothetical protein
MAWTENGPVSLPSGPALAFAVLLIGGAAVAGAGFGFSAGWRGGEQQQRAAVDPNQDIDQAVEARPLVTLAGPPAPAAVATAAATNTVAAKKADDDDDADASNEIAVKTAAVQAEQSKPADKPANIDDILTSPTERPQAPAKPTTDEQAPPAKTDVPF